jgi:hypothetical protein
MAAPSARSTRSSMRARAHAHSSSKSPHPLMSWRWGFHAPLEHNSLHLTLVSLSAIKLWHQVSKSTPKRSSTLLRGSLKSSSAGGSLLQDHEALRFSLRSLSLVCRSDCHIVPNWKRYVVYLPPIVANKAWRDACISIIYG